MVGQRADTCPGSIASLDMTAQHLLMSSLAPSSRVVYAKEFRRYEQFCSSVLGADLCFPATQPTMARYIAHLFDASYASSTIATSVSAISYFHKALGHPDPSESFYIKRLLIGVSKCNPSRDMRVPISLPMLQQLIDAVPSIASDTYTAKMVRAMFSLAFFALLRLSEITTTARTAHTLQHKDVILGDTEMQVCFSSYKHSGAHPFKLSISQQPKGVCPVRLVRDYLMARGNTQGPLFVHLDQSPVTPHLFTEHLRLAVIAARLTHLNISSHCFRLGRCTHLASLGYSEHKIKLVGRWKSDSYTRYIRVDALSC